MTRLKSLIKEALSTPPKKENIDCCCDSKKINIKGTTLNENIDKRIVMTENMQYHVQNQLPLTETNIIYGSKEYIDLWSEARYLYVRNAINVNKIDEKILTETNLGEYGIFEGEKVPLDLPIDLSKEIDNTLKIINNKDTPHPEKTEALQYIIELAHEASGTFPTTTEEALDILSKKHNKKFHIYTRDPKSKEIKKLDY